MGKPFSIADRIGELLLESTPTIARHGGHVSFDFDKVEDAEEFYRQVWRLIDVVPPVEPAPDSREEV